MKQCKCGSYEINIDPNQSDCDVCYWKNKYFALMSEYTKLTHELESIKVVNHSSAYQYKPVKYINSYDDMYNYLKYLYSLETLSEYQRSQRILLEETFLSSRKFANKDQLEYCMRSK